MNMGPSLSGIDGCFAICGKREREREREKMHKGEIFN
jgi:hypothetical protein